MCLPVISLTAQWPVARAVNECSGRVAVATEYLVGLISGMRRRRTNHDILNTLLYELLIFVLHDYIGWYDSEAK